MTSKEIKTMTLDLAKTLSYLTELQKTNDQVYVTEAGMALLEGVVIGGNSKVKVVDKKELYDLAQHYIKRLEEEKKEYSELDAKNESLRESVRLLKKKKHKFPWL